ncbi:MAG: hypothetical protein JWM11_1837 [Planctomycetaceae bacterium]|nr:hypothetical protein [Planctomycetaceae bacterium]
MTFTPLIKEYGKTTQAVFDRFDAKIGMALLVG